MIFVAPRSAKLVETTGGAIHAALRLRLHPARVPGDAAASGTRTAPTGTSALAYGLIGIGIGLAGTPASRSLTGSVPVKRAGMASAHRRPPARPRRRDHAVDPRRRADRRLRRLDLEPDRRRSERRQDHERDRVGAAEVVRERCRHGEPVPAVQGPDHRRRPRGVPQGRRLGLPGRDHRRPDRCDRDLALLPAASSARRSSSPSTPPTAAPRTTPSRPRRDGQDADLALCDRLGPGAGFHRRAAGRSDPGTRGCGLARLRLRRRSRLQPRTRQPARSITGHTFIQLLPDSGPQAGKQATSSTGSRPGTARSGGRSADTARSRTTPSIRGAGGCARPSARASTTGSRRRSPATSRARPTITSSSSTAPTGCSGSSARATTRSRRSRATGNRIRDMFKVALGDVAGEIFVAFYANGAIFSDPYSVELRFAQIGDGNSYVRLGTRRSQQGRLAADGGPRGARRSRRPPSRTSTRRRSSRSSRSAIPSAFGRRVRHRSGRPPPGRAPGRRRATRSRSSSTTSATTARWSPSTGTTAIAPASRTRPPRTSTTIPGMPSHPRGRPPRRHPDARRRSTSSSAAARTPAWSRSTCPAATRRKLQPDDDDPVVPAADRSERHGAGPRGRRPASGARSAPLLSAP